MTRTCRHCDQPAVSYSDTLLCRQHYNERRRKGRPRQPRQPSTVCKECGAPRKQGVTVALCPDHYRDYARRQVRRSRGMDPDAPVKVVDTSKCRLCDEPRLPYGVMCRQCLRNYEAERRRKAGVQPRSTTCESPGCGQPKATPHGKFCRVCYDQRQEAKVKASSRAKMSTAAKAVEKQIPRRWDTALPRRGVTEPVVGAEVFAKPEPIQPTRPVTRIRAANADEREAREREWAEWLQRRRSMDA